MKLKSLILTLALGLGIAVPAWANLPWGSTAPLQVSGATPTCTYTSTALACIENMTANVTSLTLAGMTAGTYYTIVFMQDGTGSRTLTQTAITGAPALVAGETAANAYTVWTIVATSASAATWVASYANASLAQDFKAVQASNGTAVSSLTSQAQPTVVVPGLSASNACLCIAQTLPATWLTGVDLKCLPGTNAAICEITNPTAASITPTAVNINVRIIN